MRHKVGTATIIVSVIVGLLTIYAVPLNPPLSDCFGGVFSQDPLHCYVLEQADGQGVIDIHAIYDVNGGLYVSITKGLDTFSDVFDYIIAKSTEFYDRWPDDLPDLSFYYDECLERYYSTPTLRDCYLVTNLDPIYLPKSMVYNDIWFFIGEDAARRTTPGWASWRQLWPATTSGASDASTTPATFDVSDVDMTTNLPVYHACPDRLYGHRDDICSRDRNVALSILDTHSQNGTDRNKYIEYVDPPEDAAQVLALKKIIDPCHGISWGVCEWTATFIRDAQGAPTYVDRTVKQAASVTKPDYDDIVLIPVKYNRGELMRWVEILNRFALSTGNTIGLYEATIDDNKEPKEFEVVFTSAGPGPARMTEDGRYDLSKVRTTILLAGFNAQRIADALPTLLPLLGIATDAVGVVGTMRTDANDHLVDFVNWEVELGGPSLTTRLASSLNVPLPLLLLARNVGAVLVVGGVVALVLRMRRRALGRDGGENEIDEAAT